MNIRNDPLGKNRETIHDYLLLVLLTDCGKKKPIA
jgi:hypothetical protein